MFKFSFLVNEFESTHMHTDIEFFYVIEGNAVFTLEDKEYHLYKEDFLVVNADKNHSYETSDKFLGARMHISYSELCSLVRHGMVFFWCNSSTGNTEACDELRELFKKIIYEEFSNEGKDAIALNSLFYQFLHVLTTDFLLSKNDEHYSEATHKFDERKHEIVEYIQANFDKPIRLEDLADKMYLSYAYLSKYIKRQFGMGFADYLNQVRLNYAVSQLLHSDLSIVRIALESGFSSSAALNKAFKEVYGMTPTDYRRQWVKKPGAKETDNSSMKNDIRDEITRQFKNFLPDSKKNESNHIQSVVLSSVSRKPLKRNWCKMINIGTAADLLQSDVQSHLLMLKEELGFEYVRFWDLHAPELHLGNSAAELNFSRLDTVLDFILENGMKPYIELRPKPKLVLKSAYEIIKFEDNPMTENLDEIREFVCKLVIHLLNRYGTENVEKFFFEIWCSEAEQETGTYEGTRVNGTVESYFERFNMFAREMREIFPGAKIGGGGFSLRYGQERLRNALELWTHQEQQPDFISLYFYPYTEYSLDRERNQSRNHELYKQFLEDTRETMNAVGMTSQELHVSEWSFSISNRNVLNDHCMKAAHLMRDMMESIGKCDIAGYWVGTDLYSIGDDSKNILFGGTGIISRDGIRKPSFYAFEFMNFAGKYLIKKDENYIITDNGAENWRIICHNLKHLNHQYSLMNEGGIKVDEQNRFFTDLKTKTIHFSIPTARRGKYLLKRSIVNRYSGSVQDEWVAMSMPDELSRDEIKYLRRIVTPRMVVNSVVSNDGKLEFDVELEPNEISFIHLIYQYSYE